MTVTFLLLAALLALSLVLAVIGWTFSLAGALLGLVFKLAPLIVVAIIIWFFAKGGRVDVDVHLPKDWKRSRKK